MKTFRHRKPYTPFTQQYYCCVPTCIQWILYRRRLKLVDQEKIGLMMNLTVPPKDRKYFIENVKVSKRKPRAGYGTAVTRQCENINKFFRKYKVPLKATSYYPLRGLALKDPEKFLINNFKEDNDVIAVFNLGVLDIKKKKYGHAVLVSEVIKNEKTEIVVGDPWFKNPKFWKIELTKLIQGMDKKYDGVRRGFWVVTKR